MLLQICAYIRREKVASNQQLGRIFRIDLDALQAILDLCLKKGMLTQYHRATAGGCSKTCVRCHDAPTMYYAST